jgi:hypothetical protein
MRFSRNDDAGPRARNVRVKPRDLVVDLVDGRSLTVPFDWFPRLAYGTPAQRRNWRLIARGEGIHWPALDEDICVEDILAGRRSAESTASFRKWRAAQHAARTRPAHSSRRSSAAPKRKRVSRAS